MGLIQPRAPVWRIDVGDMDPRASQRLLREVRAAWGQGRAPEIGGDGFCTHWTCAFCGAAVPGAERRCAECGAARPGRV